MLVPNRLLCFFVLNLLLSGSAIAQPASPLVTAVDKGSGNLNVTPFGLIKTWSKTNDPLGKTICFKEFNLTTTADSSDIGAFWWNARDIAKIEVVYEGPLPDNRSVQPVVQYWHQTWPEKPPK